jgi:hypothetical protein
MSCATDFDDADAAFPVRPVDAPKHRWVRTLPREAIASCFVIDMTDTSDVGPEMPLAALSRFHIDWIAACAEADVPASTPCVLGASEEQGRLRIWVRSTGAGFMAHRTHGSIRATEHAISGRMEAQHSFVDSPRLERLNDEAWGRVAGRTRTAVAERDMRLRERPLSNLCYALSAVCWIYLFAIGSIGWPVLIMTASCPAIILGMRVAESRRAASERRSEPGAESDIKDREEADRPVDMPEAGPFDAVLSRLDATDRPRAAMATAACRRILDLSADRPELREFAADLVRQTNELVQRHDEAAVLVDDDAVLGERLIVGMEALAHQADERRRAMAKGAMDGLETHVRYLSSRAAIDDPLSLPTQQGSPS